MTDGAGPELADENRVTMMKNNTCGSRFFNQALVASVEMTFRLLRDNLVMHDLLSRQSEANLLETHGS